MKGIITGGLIGLLLVAMLPTPVRADAALCTVTGDSVPYDGTTHTLSGTGSCVDGVGGALSGQIVFTPATGTAANTYPVPWTFTDDTLVYTASGTATAEITPVAASCSVTGYAVPYDGEAHTATGSCTGVGGAPLGGLDLSGTTRTNAGSGSDPWSFASANYLPQSGSVAVSISPIAADCSVTGYSLPFDGSPHTAAGSCTGLGGAPLGGLDLGGTTRTNAGSGSDPWSFTHENYIAQSGSVTDTISPIAASCSVSGYTVVYDGSPHTATGSCTGLGGAPLGGLDLSGTTRTNAGSGSDPWSFSTANYTSQSGSVTDTITPGPNAITFTTRPPAPAKIGGTYTVAATALHGTVTFAIDPSTAGNCTLTGGTTVQFTARGGCMINATAPATANYLGATAHQSVAIGDGPPACPPSSATVVMNMAVSGTPSCTDPEADYPLSFEVATPPSLGRVAFAKGQWTYTPNANATGTDAFTYLALDSLGAPSLPIPVSITIVNRPVRARNDTAAVPAVAPFRITVLANDLAGYSASTPTVDQDPGQRLTITAVGTGRLGRVTTDGRTITYDPTGCATGTDLVSYTASDGVTTSDAYVAITVLRPGSGGTAKTPLTDTPSVAFAVGSRLTATVPVKLGWCGVTATSTRIYRVMQSSNGGSTFPTTVSASTRSTSTVRSLALKAVYRFMVRTSDGAGRSSAWVKSPTVKVLRTDDGNPAISYAGAWQTSTAAGASGGSEHSATSADATATLHLGPGVRAFALVGARGAGHGSIVIEVDGVVVATVSQSASATAPAVILAARGIDPSAAHTVVLRPLGNGSVGIDAILTMQ